jgi:uncharacterized cysteine cluster protein YcgN (CxxCxxCC family)
VRKFWEHKSLTEMTAEEWESLCDGCGLCCLKKLEDEATGEIEYTDVACRLLDVERCRCTRYAARTELVADCIRLTPGTIDAVSWLPASCAYRLVAEGHPLEWWHPLVSGDPDTVHRAGISLRGRAVSERDVHPLEIEERVIHWVPFKRTVTK